MKLTPSTALLMMIASLSSLPFYANADDEMTTHADPPNPALRCTQTFQFWNSASRRWENLDGGRWLGVPAPGAQPPRAAISNLEFAFQGNPRRILETAVCANNAQNLRALPAVAGMARTGTCTDETKARTAFEQSDCRITENTCGHGLEAVVPASVPDNAIVRRFIFRVTDTNFRIYAYPTGTDCARARNGSEVDQGADRATIDFALIDQGPGRSEAKTCFILEDTRNGGRIRFGATCTQEHDVRVDRDIRDAQARSARGPGQSSSGKSAAPAR